MNSIQHNYCLTVAHTTKRMKWIVRSAALAALWVGTAGLKPANTKYLVISKSKHTVTIWDDSKWLVRWPCTFGNADMSDKMFQGDRKTPEGSFTIVNKRPHNKWNKFMLLDYPTKSDYEKFNARKAKGLIPASAKIGGDIGIHGTWPREDWAVERLQNWTLGCISMKNHHLDELYTMVDVGTVVIIQR